MVKAVYLEQLLKKYRGLDNKQFNASVIRNFDLSDSEVELITHISKGFSSEEIVGKMFLSKHTIDSHRRNIHAKTGTRNAVVLLNLLK